MSDSHHTYDDQYDDHHMYNDDQYDDDDNHTNTYDARPRSSPE